MFNLSSDNWPGLAKLNEEAGEVIQIIGCRLKASPNIGMDLTFEIVSRKN